MCGLGNRKNEFIGELLDTEGVDLYEDSIAWVRHVRRQGFATAVVSASKNCERVLRAAGIDEPLAHPADIRHVYLLTHCCALRNKVAMEPLGALGGSPQVLVIQVQTIASPSRRHRSGQPK